MALGIGSRSRLVLVSVGLLLSLSAHRASAFDPLQRAERAVQRSRAAMAAGDTSLAIDEMLKAQALAPDDPRVRHALGEVFYEGTQYPSASRIFEGLLRDDAGARDGLDLRAQDLLYNAGNAAFEQQDLEQALQLYTEALVSAGPEEEIADNLLYNLELTQALIESQQSQDGGEDSSDDSQEQQEGEQQDQQSQESSNENSEDQQQGDEQQQQQEQQEKDSEEGAPPDSTQSQSSADSTQEASADSLAAIPEGMTPQEAMRLLEALDQDEEELRQSIQRRLRGGESEDDGDW